MNNLLYLLLFVASSSLAAPILPDPILTPGEVYTTDADIACAAHTGNEPDSIRDVSNTTKRQVFNSYGLRGGNHTGYCNESPLGCEMDHLVSAKLGGTNSKKNLWPQSYAGKDEGIGAIAKDNLEKRLIARVCRTSKKHPVKLPLIVAQQAIMTDWRAAYIRFVINNE